MPSNWTDTLPSLARLDEATKILLRETAQRVKVPRGTVLFRPGDECPQFPIITEGSVRVQRITESGREIVLYRVAANETCILTTACLIGNEAYAAEGVTETDIVAYCLTPDRFRMLLDRSAAFRALVFEGYSRRIATLMSRIEEIACTRIDIRLADRLLALSRNGGQNSTRTGKRIETTQQALAADLGTAREVIGRTLKVFEESGWVRLSRGGIEILDSPSLTALCKHERDPGT